MITNVEVPWIVFLVVPIGIFIVVLLLAYFIIDKPKKFALPRKHAFITGGSSGIGLALADQLIRAGTVVTIVARDKTKLKEAITKLEPATSSTQVGGLYTLSADVSDVESIQSAINQATTEKGAIDIFIGCAGITHPGYFEEIPLQQFESLMRTNFFGNVNALKCIVPSMKARRQGRIVLIGSMAGLTGVFGYTAYSASKFALRGFAEALHMELSAYNVFVTVVNPPDVDTPQLQAENLIKPIETKRISEGSGVFTAEKVASDVISAIKSWKFFVSTGFDGALLSVLALGTAPASSPIKELIAFSTLGILRFISLFYTYSFNKIVTKCRDERIQNKLPIIGNSEKGDKHQ